MDENIVKQQPMPPVNQPQRPIKYFTYADGTRCQERYPIDSCTCNGKDIRETIEKYREYNSLSCIDPQTFNKRYQDKLNEESKYRIQAQKEFNEVENFKKTPEGKQFINRCIQRQRQLQEVVNSCAVAYNKDDCIKTRFDDSISAQCNRLNIPGVSLPRYNINILNFLPK
jgi:hypothetical protein